jgi:hypothetical protein
MSTLARTVANSAGSSNGEGQKNGIGPSALNNSIADSRLDETVEIHAASGPEREEVAPGIESTYVVQVHGHSTARGIRIDTGDADPMGINLHICDFFRTRRSASRWPDARHVLQ